MTEKVLHRHITEYLRRQYSKILFNTDLSGIRLSMGQAKQVKNLRSGRGFPDIVIYEPNMFHSCLFLEVKKESPFTKSGALKSDPHLREQQDMMERLNENGYAAMFVWTFEMAKERIDTYMSLRAQAYEDDLPV